LNKTAVWVRTARLRTLPLSVSGILVGSGLALAEQEINWLLFALCIFITIGFQVTSNFANDYGDGVKGTDGADRVGPARAIQSGALTPKELLKGIYISSAISLALAIWLLWMSFGADQLLLAVFFFILALISIGGALKYTMGNNPYGYQGMGDLAVLLFFGLLAVWGTRFILTQSWSHTELLPAIGVGLLCTAVLNLNNLRDYVSDEKHGKRTLVVKMGFSRGKRYHFLLLSVSLALFIAYFLLSQSPPQLYFALWPFLILALHARRVATTSEPVNLDPELKVVALSTFFLSLSFFLLNVLFS
jgi:1,4-dihydroxy-2-naphthoate octaprenyltransferase